MTEPQTPSFTRQVTQAFERVDRLNPGLNAMATLRRVDAFREARALDALQLSGAGLGRLAGVVMTIKDALRVEGCRTTWGLPQFLNQISTHDSEIVRRLREEGAIIIGRTNIPTAGFDWQCSNPLFGETTHPLDEGRTPGGSSGGSAAALAAGLVDYEFGTDLGGSIRLPAHFCGVVGLRTTDGLFPVEDLGPEGLEHPPYRDLVVAGPMARTLEGTERLLTAVLRDEPRAPLTRTPSGKLRVGFWKGSDLAPFERSCSHAWENWMSRLASDPTIELEEAPPPFDWERAFEVWGLLAGAEFRNQLPRQVRGGAGRKILEWVFLKGAYGNGPVSVYFSRGLDASTSQIEEARQERTRIQALTDQFFERFSLWITPVCPDVAIKRQRLARSIQIDDIKVPYTRFFGHYLCPPVVMGTPALSLPIAEVEREQGLMLPMGVQVHGPRFSDLALLQAARNLHPSRRVLET